MIEKYDNSDISVVVCVKNEGYPASLEVLKLYQVILDQRASQYHRIRVIDESGEDYLYPSSYFVALEVPEAVKHAFPLAA